uniref:Uncharacterized protein n=1 Tax=Anguilla anguilla TaxID=7936 RepID=A0A0E9QKI3_ANGAN
MRCKRKQPATPHVSKDSRRCACSQNSSVEVMHECGCS